MRTSLTGARLPSGALPTARSGGDRPNYPGLCSTGTVGMTTGGNNVMQKGVPATSSTRLSRTNLTESTASPLLSRPRYF
jgi:hypothetical protein